MYVILDNGHGRDTAGKRSPVWPDGRQLFEWEFNRHIVRCIKELCDRHGIPCEVLVPEDTDVPLAERVRRANAIWYKHSDAILLSIHANAGGGTGWEAFTSPGKTKSDAIADIFYKEAAKTFPDARMRTDMSDGDNDKEERFYILTKTACPAVLTENFFMDTLADCEILMSPQQRQKIADFHFAALMRCKNIP
jgi:N-acetylmuramoyl-L-alanine amidase